MESNTLHKLSTLGAQAFTVGDARVTVLSDGYISIGAELLQGISPEDYAARMQAAFVTETAHNSAVNAFLIESAGKTILVDAGSGQSMGPSLGRLPETLDILGVLPTDVDMLVATHLHPDHIGGIVGENGNPFTNAEFVVHGAEVDMWCSIEARDGAPEQFQPFFDLARTCVESFGDRVKTVQDKADLGAGLSVAHQPGHTPGHMGVMLDSGGAQLFIMADIVHVPPVQFAMPDVTIGFDADPDAARATRMRVLDMAAADKIWIAGSHITFPGLGHVEKVGSGYRLEPSRWQYA